MCKQHGDINVLILKQKSLNLEPIHIWEEQKGSICVKEHIYEALRWVGQNDTALPQEWYEKNNSLIHSWLMQLLLTNITKAFKTLHQI